MSGSGDSQPPVRVVLVVAMARNRVIGAAGGLPWRLPSDLKRFRSLTLGHPVVMGRKTFQSIGRPLDGRTNIVVTGDPGLAAEGVLTAATPQAALALGRQVAGRTGAEAVMVIGGGTIYAATIGEADRLLVTEVDAEPEGDTVFPAIDPALFREISREPIPRGERDSAAMTLVTYERLARPA